MYKGKRLGLNNFGAMLLICLAVSVLSVLTLSFIFALVAHMSKDPTGSLGIFSLATLLLSAIISGFTSAKIKREGAVGFSALVALICCLIMLMICLVNFSCSTIRDAKRP